MKKALWIVLPLCVLALSVVALRGVPFIEASRGADATISEKQAKAPFLLKRFRLIPDLSSNIPTELVAQYVIYPSNLRNFVPLGELRIFTNTSGAKRSSSTTSPGWMHAPSVYRVANIVLDVDVIKYGPQRRKLLSALGTLGTPLRVFRAAPDVTR
jgi:hypothetical protein